MLLILVTASGCAAAVQDANEESQTDLRKRAAFDLGCDAGKLAFEPLDTYPNGYVTTWGVLGCGNRATYIKASNGQWVMNSGTGGDASPESKAAASAG